MATMTSAGPEDLLQTLGLLARCGLPRDGLETSDTVIVVAKDDETVREAMVRPFGETPVFLQETYHEEREGAR
jgi:hypothetical protein